MNASFPTLTDQEQLFIREHLTDTLPELLLQASRYPGVDVRKMAGQIAARQKARHKLPDWYANERLLFPPALSVEQGSSEATARFKASLVGGRQLIDITGGMGVDCYYMSQRFERALYFEQQPDVAQSAAYNFAQLGAKEHIEVRTGDAIAALNHQPEPADWIYADPARRDDRQRKVAQLADCTPDIVAALPVLFHSAPQLLLKTAPLLDIDLATRQLGHVREVYVIGLDNECKEVLYSISRDPSGQEEMPIRVRILHDDGRVKHTFDFTRREEADTAAPMHEPMAYLYEPHAALLKSGAFKSLAARYGLAKLSPNAHLYTSDRWLPDFPGRGFGVTALCKPDAREVALHVPDGKAHLTTRNFPVKTDDLRKKLRLKEGGDTYLFATELQNKRKVVIVTQKAYIE